MCNCVLYILLRPRERLRSIVMSASVCLYLSVCLSVCLSVSLSDRISPEPLARSLPILLCLLPMSVARSSSGMFTIGRIAYRREGIFFPIDNCTITRSLQKGSIIRSPITSCSTGIILLLPCSLRMGSAGKGVTGVQSAGEV